MWYPGYQKSERGWRRERGERREGTSGTQGIHVASVPNNSGSSYHWHVPTELVSLILQAHPTIVKLILYFILN